MFGSLIRGSVFAAFATVLVGCGPAHVPVSGSVTVDGKPMDDGSIAFVPLDGSAEQVTVGGHVANGTYSIDKTRGLSTGKYKVEIRWSKKTGKKVPNGDGGTNDVVVEGLPAKYNTSSELTAEIKSGPNVDVNFDVKP
jgi:hypothetical protein